MNLFPLSFTEFLGATGNGRYAELIEKGDLAMMNTFSDKLKELLRTYYIVGGMPEAVNAYIDTADVRDAREVQDQILVDYMSDFAKHVPANLLARTMLAWDSIPKHLSKENKKFVFGHVRKGARAADFEESLRWLEQAGLIVKVPRVSKPGMPLKAYRDQNAFKVFMLDIGLLGAMSGLSPAALVDGSSIFTEFKGALTEQYVCQQLVSDCGLVPFYWSAENSSGEIDFLVQAGSGVYPIEVKAEENLRAKSLRAFNGRYEGMSPAGSACRDSVTRAGCGTFPCTQSGTRAIGFKPKRDSVRQAVSFVSKNNPMLHRSNRTEAMHSPASPEGERRRVQIRGSRLQPRPARPRSR